MSLEAGQVIQQGGEFGQQGLEVLQPVLPSDQDDDGKRQRGQILLELQGSICGDERIEFRRCQCQQLAILDAGPSFISDGRNLMVKYQYRQVVGQRLIKQETHRPPVTPWPSQERPLPVRG